MFRISNTTNSDLNVSTSAAGTIGWGALILTDDSVVPGTITINSSSPSGAGSGWMLLLEGSKNFDKSLTYASDGSASAVTHGLGAYSGNVVYRGTVTNSGTGANTANLQWHAESGATLTLGATGNAADFVTTRTGQGGTVVNNYRKTGAGTAILENVAHTGNYTYEIQNGVLRETGNGATNSTQGVYLTLSGGVLETSNTLIGGNFNRTLSATAGATNLNWSAGGFAAYGGDLVVDLNTAGTRDNLSMGSSPLAASTSATGMVLSSGTATHTVEVYDNLDFRFTAQTINVPNGSAAVDARITGNLISGNNSASLVKTGAGTLELTGTAATNHGATTQVNGGTLLVNNTSGSGLFNGMATVNNGGTLGGTGTISGAVTVNAGGKLAPGNSVGTLTTSANATFNANSILSVELESNASYDSLVVTGTGTFNGNLAVSLLNSFVPASGDVFTIISGTAVTGAVGNLNGSGKLDVTGGTFDVLFDGAGLKLTNFTGTVTFIKGDMNGSGVVNNQDIAPFVLALTNYAQYQIDFPGLDGVARGDINLDTFLNNQDIAPFVTLLTGGRPLSEFANDPDFAPLFNVVPEPASLSLLALGSLALRRRRRG